MRKLIDINGEEHESVQITIDHLEDWGSMYAPNNPIKHLAGLKHYRVDGKEVTPERFHELFPDLKE